MPFEGGFRRYLKKIRFAKTESKCSGYSRPADRPTASFRIYFPAAGHQAVGQKTVLSGRPSDTNAVPVESAMEVGEKFPYEMPAYSFTVIRIKRECK